MTSEEIISEASAEAAGAERVRSAFGTLADLGFAAFKEGVVEEGNAFCMCGHLVLAVKGEKMPLKVKVEVSQEDDAKEDTDDQ